MLSSFLAALCRLSEYGGLRALGYVLVTIRGPHVTELRIVFLVIAAMHDLFRPVLELQHQVAERGGADFNDFSCMLILLTS